MTDPDLAAAADIELAAALAEHAAALAAVEPLRQRPPDDPQRQAAEARLNRAVTEVVPRGGWSDSASTSRRTRW